MIAALLALGLAAPPSALAAPVRQTGWERPLKPSPEDASGGARFADGFLSVGGYAGNRGAASARPDGSGAAAVREELFLRDHLDSDRWRFVGDAVALSDRRRVALRPASVDYYVGAARHSEFGWAQVGWEEALALDESGRSSRAWDLRLGRSAYAETWSAGGYVAWLLRNDGREARPDLSGEALLRYAGFIEAAPRGPLRLRLHGALVTDRRRRAAAPVSLDLAASIGAAWKDFEIGLGWEPRLSLDRRGSVDAWTLSTTMRFDSRELFREYAE